MNGDASPFEGDLIRLRAHEPEDEPQLHEWMNDPEVTEHLSVRYPLSHGQEHDFVREHGAIGYTMASFSVETLAESKLIGTCGLHDTSPENRSAILGISIGDKAYWDAGYGTDTMRTLCRFGFDAMNLHRIELDVYEPNQRARHVYEKIGFRVEGVRRQATYRRGRYLDVVVMGLLEGELR